MSSRGESPDPARRRAAGRGGGFRPEPDVASATGGQLAPDMHSTGPLLDPLTGEVDGPPIGPGDPSGPRPERRPTGRQPRASMRRRVTTRRVKRTLRHVDPVSVLKLSLFYYGIFLVAWLIFVAILYAIVNAMGVFETIEKFGEGFALGWDVNITLFFVERWAFLIGFIFLVLASLTNVALAFLYNVGADMLGGVEMTFVERDN